MTAEEAKKALEEGKKIRHFSWEKDWYVVMLGGKIVDETKTYNCPYVFHNNKSVGWEIVE